MRYRTLLAQRIQFERVHQTSRQRRAIDRMRHTDDKLMRATNYVLAALAGGIIACVATLLH